MHHSSSNRTAVAAVVRLVTNRPVAIATTTSARKPPISRASWPYSTDSGRLRAAAGERPQVDDRPHDGGQPDTERAADHQAIRRSAPAPTPPGPGVAASGEAEDAQDRQDPGPGSRGQHAGQDDAAAAAASAAARWPSPERCAGPRLDRGRRQPRPPRVAPALDGRGRSQDAADLGRDHRRVGARVQGGQHRHRPGGPTLPVADVGQDPVLRVTQPHRLAAGRAEHRSPAPTQRQRGPRPPRARATPPPRGCVRRPCRPVRHGAGDVPAERCGARRCRPDTGRRSAGPAGDR